MNINLLPYALFWGVLALAVVFLIVYRKTVSSHEDDSHSPGGRRARRTGGSGARLALIDRWGKTLTVVVVLYGVALGGHLFVPDLEQRSATTNRI